MLGSRPAYRPLLAVDIERSAGRGDRPMLDNRAVLKRALQRALTAAGTSWEACHLDRAGDSIRLVLDRDVPKPEIFGTLVPQLAAGLRAHNRSAGPSGTVRVRAAVHAGDVQMDDGEVVGGSLEVLARLLEADPLRRALATAPATAALALAVSPHLYEDVLRHGYEGVDPELYRAFPYQVKETRSVAWLHVPGHPEVVLALDAEPPHTTPSETPADDRSGRGARYVTFATGNATVGEVIGHIDTRVDHVTGDVHVGAAAPAAALDLERRLAELHRAITNERTAGRLDESTYQAATDEVRAAGQCLSAPDGPDRPRLVLALRRLKGLVDEIAELATKVLAAIAAARAL